MKVSYIIQARMRSTRLPGKIFEKIGDKTLLGHIIRRLELSGAARSEIVIAAADESDAAMEVLLKSLNVEYYLGSVQNVLNRFIGASRNLGDDDLVVRLTGDNPFLDYKCLRENVLACLKDSHIDLSYPWKLPLGMGFEIIRKGALDRQTEYELKLHHEEHVTTFIKENPSIFRIVPQNYFSEDQDIRLTIDYPEDLEQARKTHFYFSSVNKSDFCSAEVYELNRSNPEFFKQNVSMKQKSPTEYENR